MGDYSEFLEIAKEVALSAGELLMGSFRKPHEEKLKSEKDLVTDMDIASEKLIISTIRKRYPDHSFLGEEGGKSPGKKGSDYTWVIDPIDGTNNYAFGLKLFGVSIALLKGKEPIVGVINVPAFGELFWATKGGGAFHNGKPVHVSNRKRLEDSLVFFHANMEEGRETIMSLVEKLADASFILRMFGAAVLHLTGIAIGVGDAWVELDARPWDIAAGSLIVEEAGGKVTDFKGDPWSVWSGNLLVSNGKVHDEALEILKKEA